MELLESVNRHINSVGFLSACFCYRYFVGFIKTYLLKWGLVRRKREETILSVRIIHRYMSFT